LEADVLDVHHADVPCGPVIAAAAPGMPVLLASAARRPRRRPARQAPCAPRDWRSSPAPARRARHARLRAAKQRASAWRASRACAAVPRAVAWRQGLTGLVFGRE